MQCRKKCRAVAAVLFDKDLRCHVAIHTISLFALSPPHAPFGRTLTLLTMIVASAIAMMVTVTQAELIISEEGRIDGRLIKILLLQFVT